MWKSDRNKLLLLPKRYPCLDSFIVVLFYAAINAVVILGVMLFIQTLAIAFRALMDINLLLPFLKTDYIVLFCVSILTIISGCLGIFSGFQYSKSGLLTSMGFFIITFFIIDGYAIGFRVKDYLSESHLNDILYDAIKKDPRENFQFHFMQRRLSCCGVSYYSNWIAYHNVIPGSCCNNMTICMDNDPTLYKTGCLKVISEILHNTFQTTVDTIIILNVFLVLALFSGYFYWYLLRQVKKTEKLSFFTLPRINISMYSKNQPSQSIFIINTADSIQSENNTLENNNYDIRNASVANENNNARQQTQSVTMSKDNLKIQKENNTVQEVDNATQEENNKVQEEGNTVQEESNTTQEEPNRTQEEANTAPEEANTAQKETNTVQKEDNTS